MKIKEIYDFIKVNHCDFIVFIKYGNFYKIYNDDAFIINKITGYKLVDGIRVGFPINSLNKILKRVEFLNISYVIFNSVKDYYIIENKNNNYSLELNKAMTSYLEKKRIDDIVKRFRNLISTDIEKLEYYERKI